MNYSNSATVDFTCEQMYQLVSDIESYPNFISFCRTGRLDQIHDDGYTATLEYQVGKITKSFTTRNKAQPHSEILMKLVSGPFKRLDGKWTFANVGANKCHVKFEVDYEFSSRAAEFALGPFFKSLQKIMLDNFCSEAKRKFGTR